MRLTDKGITNITMALDLAEDFLGSRMTLNDVELQQQNPTSVTVAIADTGIYGVGTTFDEAARALYEACKAAHEPAFEEKV